MPVSSGRKVLLIGLDSITPVMIERMLQAGDMPNLARLAASGWSSEVVPTMPPTTPAGWTTVATGAWPSTHGIEGFAVHRQGDPLDRKVHSLTTDLVRAEQLWQVAERAGLDSVLLKFPVSWPPTGGDRVIQVDGAGGWGGLKCVHDLVHSACWDTAAGPPAPAPDGAVAQEWMTRDADNLDEEATGRLEVVEYGAGWRIAFALRGRNGGTAPVRAEPHGGDRVVLATDGGRSRAVGRGEWTDWLPVTLGPDAGWVRFRVMELSAADRRLRLYQSQVHRRDGFTRPAGLAAELEAALGPFVEWTEAYDLLQGWIDHDTQLEIYRQHLAWMTGAGRLLLRRHPWHLFMTQVHVLDMAYHVYWGAVDPGHPDHRPEDAPRFWRLLRDVHRLTDDFVGALLEEADDDTLVVVVGDHGQDLYHTALMTNHLLLRAGLLALQRDPRTGRPRVDWRRTRAYASGYRVYLNVRDRDPEGVVEPGEYAAAQERVIQALNAARDPRTGQAPVRLAVRREDAVGLGLYGPNMGDVVLAVAPGFQVRSAIQPPAGSWVGGRLAADRVPVFQPTRLFREFTGEHDSSLPHTRSIRTLLYAAGPGVRPGRRAVPVDLVDVAPTLCAWLGLPAPAQCEGRPIADLFDRPLGGFAERKHVESEKGGRA
ncbi:MAG TPA: alkaline phosphatase family protein [Candidatus Dormibacteraeota bacterium]|nr:alkaline phosphatase family protein [Candidatus Dormibacteraeota bacterium]